MTSHIEALRKKHDELCRQYREHIDAVRALQCRAKNDIALDVHEELRRSHSASASGSLDLEPSEDEVRKVVLEYVEDTGAIFRLLKRHKFISSFAYEALRDIVLWRAKTFPNLLSPNPKQAYSSASGDTPNGSYNGNLHATIPVRCVPLNHRDDTGRPILVIKLAETDVDLEVLKREVIVAVERLRLLLKSVNDADERKGPPVVLDGGHGVNGDAVRDEPESVMPVLQCVLVIDVEGAPLSVMSVDLMSWYTRELQPRYHGMLAAAYCVNYSWTHAGVWNISKHLLPASAVLRFVLLSPSECGKFLPPSAVPSRWNSLPTLAEITKTDVPQTPKSNHRPSQRRISTSVTSPTFIPSPNPRKALSNQVAHLPRPVSRFSLANPFFGYPVVSPSSAGGTPGLRHGRRRKRDLVMSLAVLFWNKWKSRLVLFAVLALGFLIHRRRRRGGGIISPPLERRLLQVLNGMLWVAEYSG